VKAMIAATCDGVNLWIRWIAFRCGQATVVCVDHALARHDIQRPLITYHTTKKRNALTSFRVLLICLACVRTASVISAHEHLSTTWPPGCAECE
jgi:hypothetical protein